MKKNNEKLHAYLPQPSGDPLTAFLAGRLLGKLENSHYRTAELVVTPKGAAWRLEIMSFDQFARDEWSPSEAEQVAAVGGWWDTPPAPMTQEDHDAFTKPLEAALFGPTEALESAIEPAQGDA